MHGHVKVKRNLSWPCNCHASMPMVRTLVQLDASRRHYVSQVTLALRAVVGTLHAVTEISLIKLRPPIQQLGNRTVQ
jgi:hypothetical protein